MKIAIHQPNYLPWIGFFDKMDKVDKFVLLDTAIHSKSGFTNRNKIKTPQGPYTLTVPITAKEIPINELTIDNKQNWKRHHWKLIESNYKKSKHWNDLKDGFAEIYEADWDKLVELNIALILHIKTLLSINTDIILESVLSEDFGTGNTRNVNIVKHLNGSMYLSGTGAKVYNEENEFTDNNILLVYQQFNHPVYEQRWGKFITNLSIIDLLFHCGPKAIETIREQRE